MFGNTYLKVDNNVFNSNNNTLFYIFFTSEGMKLHRFELRRMIGIYH